MKILPYWLTGNDETCPACGQTYSHRAGKTCAGCDRDLCIVCIELHENEVLCVECGVLESPKRTAARKTAAENRS